MIYKIFISSFAILLAAMSLAGCGLLSGRADNAVSYVRGDLSGHLNVGLASAWIAAQTVADESKFEIKSKRNDAYSAVIKAQDAQLRPIDIVLEKKSDDLTSIRIRVGLLGDAELSQALLDQIQIKSLDRDLVYPPQGSSAAK